MPQLQPEFVFRALSLVLITLLAVILVAFSLISMRKENQFSETLKGMFWFIFAITCLCAVILFANSLEKIRALKVISPHVKAMILGFQVKHESHGS